MKFIVSSYYDCKKRIEVEHSKILIHRSFHIISRVDGVCTITGEQAIARKEQ
jgi:hypothetical protein